MIVIILIIILVSFYFLFVKPLSYWKEKNVIQTKPVPIFGDNLKGLLGREGLPEFITRIYDSAQDRRYIGFYQMGKPTLMIKDPELIKQILVKDFDHFMDHSPVINPDVDPLWGNNLFALRGQKWREMRVTLSPAFTSSKIKFMFGLINEAAENFTKYYLQQDKEIIEIELKDSLSRFTNDVIATTAFGVKVDSMAEKDNEFYQMGVETTNFTSFSAIVRTLVFVCFPKVALCLKMGAYSAPVKKFFRGLIRYSMDERQKRNIVRPDMIHLLMEVQKNGEENNKLTYDEITAQALLFFFAGFDSVSAAMCFTFYELAVNQDIQDKLRQEISQIPEANYEDIQNLKYLDMVVNETLRKWPSFSSTDRVCNKPYTIQPTKPNESPVDLKVGDKIFIPTYALQKDPNYWVNPDKFDPERFSDVNKSKIVPYTYMPFGGGPRLCIGSRFALLEIKIILFYLLKQFKIVPNEKSDIPITLHPRTFSMTAKNGFWFNLERL